MSGFIDNLRADNFSMSFGENVLFSDANMSQGAPLAVGGAAIYMFRECYNFNSNITIPNSLVNAYDMFYYCSNLNSPVTIDPINSNLNCMAYMFQYCGNFNQDINIPSSTRNMYSVFQGCYNMNSNIYLYSNCCRYYDYLPEEMGNLNGAFSSGLGGNPNVFFMNIEPNICSYMFAGCGSLNQNIQIPSSVNYATGMFRYCYNLNRNIRLPDDVMAGECFAHCGNFNRNIRIPHNSSITAMFYNCANFNQPVHVPVPMGTNTDEQGYNIYRLFNNCANLNANVVFNSQIKSLNGVFYSCRNFNYNITLPSQVETLPETFSGCRNFNQNIVIPSNVTNMHYTFSSCYNFDQCLTLPSGLQRMTSTFSGCNNFNQNIYIPDSVEIMSSTFSTCRNLNQSIHMPDNATALEYVFYRCDNFNSTITLPSGVRYLNSMFENCFNYDKPISIPSSVEHMTGMFWNCYNYNQPITIPEGVISVNNAFRCCINMHQNVVIPSSVNNIASVFQFSGVSNIDVQCSAINIKQGTGGYGIVWSNLCSLPNFAFFANNTPCINVEGKTPADINYNGGDVVARINFNRDCILFWNEWNSNTRQYDNFQFTADEVFINGYSSNTYYFLGCSSGYINGSSREVNQPANYMDYQRNYANAGYVNIRSLNIVERNYDTGSMKLVLQDWRNTYQDPDLGSITPSYPIYFNLI